MGERPPETTSDAEWAQIERRRKLVVWAGVGLTVIAVAIGAWFLLGRAPKTGGSARYVPIPGSDVATFAASSDVTASAGASGAPDIADSTPAAPPSGGTSPVTRECRIAYRRAGKLCVAKPDGTGEVILASSASGVFSLSPDGRTLAYVDASRRVLTLVDVASGKHAEVGPSALEIPEWPLGSEWCVYEGAGSQAGVRRVSRDGSGAKAIFAGTAPAVSNDGAVVAGIRIAGNGSSAIVVLHSAKTTVIPVTGYVVDIALSASRVFYAVAADDLAQPEIRSVDLKGGGTVVLRSGTQAGARASFQDLCASGDGNRLAYAEAGDDGYSRIFAMDAAGGGSPVTLSVRRDDYPMCWGCDGRLFFIEGNAWQGESTKLMSVQPDGTGRTTVLEGASR
ncbi:MAG: hypothetical protein CVT66_10205 [Actinobacteria bacterium HGW-Actinobacteria-6]|nr:MAG: hypothetical protein CVT66_10205 [Actinobacteria bacterium HGW-Actinobacteria-6]